MSMPLGAKKSTYLRKSPKWTPKKWKPVYNSIVLLDVQNVPRSVIAEKYGYSEQQLSNILNTPDAIAMKKKISERLEKDLLDETESDLKAISRRSIQIVKAVLFSDELVEKAPMAMFDRAERFLKSTGKIGDPERKTGGNTTNNFLIGNDIAKQLVDGLTKANRVQEIHQIPEKAAS